MARDKKKESTLTPEEKLAQALVPEEEQPYQVPRNWCWAYWGNCGEFIAGNGFKNEYQGFQNLPIPFYKVGSLKYSDFSGYLYDASNTIDEEIRGKLKATIIPTNSVIFAKIGEAIRLNRRSLNAVPCCIDNNLMAFITNRTCLYSYAFYWSKGVELYDYTNATTVPAIRKSDLEMIPFPIPPLAEQQRIVDRIEYLFAKLDEAKEKAQSVMDSFETRKAAILHKAFTGELTAKWRAEHGVHFTPNSYSLIEVFNFIDYRGMTPDKTDSGIPLITAKNIKKGYIDYRISEYISQETYLQRLGRGIARRNDLLITTEAPLGNVALADQDTYSTAQRVIVLQLREEYRNKVNNKYVMHYMLNESFQAKLQDQKTGSTVAGIKAAKLKLIPIVLPCVAEQAEVVRILDSLFAKEQQAKEAAEAVLEKIDLLKKSILARAFRGELGTNAPAEESALELLKQILQEDVPAAPKKRSKSIPKELKEKLVTELERKIVKLYFKQETDSLPAEELLSVSSKKFEVMDSLHNLEQRGILKKLPNGNYRLLE